MHRFQADYDCAPHPAVLEALGVGLGRNWPLGTYGDDDLVSRARNIILDRVLGAPRNMEAEVFFVPSGTAANRLCLATIGGPSFNTILSSGFAHINVHEAGATESMGHKIVPIPTHAGGKIEPHALKMFLKKAGDVHRVQPAVLSISNATEFGAVYTYEELCKLKDIVQDLRIHVDGARISNAIASLGWKDLTDIGDATLCDTLSIGMAKNGALLGDIVVVVEKGNIQNARGFHKQFGYLSPHMQFYAAEAIALFEGDLWLKNAQNANAMALLLADTLKEMGIYERFPVESNAVFVQLEQDVIDRLVKAALGILWDEGERIMRFMSSWSTTKDDVEGLVRAITGG